MSSSPIGNFPLYFNNTNAELRSGSFKIVYPACLNPSSDSPLLPLSSFFSIQPPPPDKTHSPLDNAAQRVISAASPLFPLNPSGLLSPSTEGSKSPSHAFVVAPTSTPKKKKQAEYEIEIMQKCNLEEIPGIPVVQTLALEDSSNESVMLMPWLKHRLADQYGKKNPSELKEIFHQICITVCELHKINIAHYDIKPENILLDKNGKCYLVDFGCAVEIDPETGNYLKNSFDINEGTTTENYSPPKAMDLFPKLRDVFSLGLTMFEVYTEGKTVFKVSNAGSKRFENLSDYIWSAADEDFEKAVDKCIDDHNLKDLLKKMMALDEKKRLTMRQVLEHPYFQS